MTYRRRDVLAGGALVGAALTVAAPAAPAIAKDVTVWRMATAWPRDLPGPGVSARRIAERIGAMSDGRLRVEVFGVGELAPAFGVFDAVATGGAEIGHAASVFWSGKTRAAALFTSAPFGLTPWEHLFWIEAGGGQAVWDALYEPFGVFGMLGGNTGPSMGGWFRSPIEGLDDLKGLKMRIAGLGGQTLQALGVATTAVAPAEIATSLQTGVVDAAEFASPFADRALGLDRLGATGMWPGFHEPNGASEALINRSAWDALPSDLQAIVTAACREEHARGLADAERGNAAALEAFMQVDADAKERGAAPLLATWPVDVLEAARGAAESAIGEVAGESPAAAAVVENWRAAHDAAALTAEFAHRPFLAARRALS